MTTHLTAAGSGLISGSLFAGFGAYSKRRTLLLLGMVVCLAVAMSAATMGANSAILRNWTQEVGVPLFLFRGRGKCAVWPNRSTPAHVLLALEV